jgi:hypothetical protein
MGILRIENKTGNAGFVIAGLRRQISVAAQFLAPWREYRLKLYGVKIAANTPRQATGKLYSAARMV